MLGKIYRITIIATDTYSPLNIQSTYITYPSYDKKTILGEIVKFDILTMKSLAEVYMMREAFWSN